MRISTLVVEDGSDPEENGSNQIGRDGVLAEDVERSNVAGGDISQTTVFHGVDPEEHAKLISRVAQLESSAKGSVDSSSEEIEEDEGELTPIRETEFYEKSLGRLKEATSFAAVAILLSIVLFVYSMETPRANDDQLKQCDDGVIQPGDIHSHFDGWTCEEVEEFQANRLENWGVEDSALLVSLLLLPMALLTLWRPSWNPARILDVRIGRMQTPYRSVGIWTILSSFLIFLLWFLHDSLLPDSVPDDELTIMDWCFCIQTCGLFGIGLNLLFLSAGKDESGSVIMERADEQDGPL